jgi:hypothetical protein
VNPTFCFLQTPVCHVYFVFDVRRRLKDDPGALATSGGISTCLGTCPKRPFQRVSGDHDMDSLSTGRRTLNAIRDIAGELGVGVFGPNPE